MQKHDEIEELAALAAIGLLSDAEYGALIEHLRACDRCRNVADQFDFILHQLPLPEPETNDQTLQELQAASYRQRFLQRASAEGVRFTPEALGQKKHRRTRIWLGNWRSYAFGAGSAFALAALASLLFFAGWLPRRHAAPPAPNASLEAKNAALPAVIQNAANSEHHSNADAKSMARLQQAYGDAEKRLDSMRRELARTQAEYRELLLESQQSKAQGAQIQARNQLEEAQLREANSRLEKLGRENDQLAASLVSQEFRIKELSEQLEDQKAAVERERQLTAASGDVRELMGARQLHVIDVADLDAQGKSKKSFGRVFYTEGRSLIFYAFDLSQKGSASKVSFQAWGQSNGERNIKNLGSFHVDDQAQKRWVLRVNDPELLKSVESVFVTVESNPATVKPLGRKLLYAYLGSPANHP